MRTELHVPSDLRFLSIVENWLLGSLQAEIGESIDWATHSNRLRLVLVEAYSNVVRHAHKNQPNLPVLMRLELRGRDIQIEIWDYGEGYDLSTYLPPNPQDLQEHGYGWLILNRLMDKVEYRLQINGRNCLKLESTLPGQEFQDINLDPRSMTTHSGSAGHGESQPRSNSTDSFPPEPHPTSDDKQLAETSTASVDHEHRPSGQELN